MFGRKKTPAKSKTNRAERLQSDCLRVSRLFKTHPFISIKDSFGVPAEKYVVVYKVEGLHLIGKAIEAKNEHVVEILLPPGYPDALPVCKSLSPVFHPNFTAEMIDIKGHWSNDVSLTDLIVRIGEMITFQKYITANAINTEAGKWVDRNMSLLPLSGVDLSAREPEPLPVVTGANEKKSEKKQPEQPVSDNIFVNEIVIQDEQQLESPGTLDARKTEGIIVNQDTAQLSVEQDADVSSPEKASVPESEPQPQNPPKEHRDAQEVEVAPAPQQLTSDIHAIDNVPTPEPKQVTVDVPPALDSSVADGLPEQKTAASQMVLFEFFYCPYCGNKNNKDANFCMNCGSRLKPMKKKNTVRTLFIISMIVVPVAILLIGSAIVIMHAVHQAPKTGISAPIVSPPPLPEQEKPALPPPEPVAPVPEKKPAEKTITPAGVAQKMLQPKTGTARLSEQQKNDKVADLLHTAKLYLSIGSYDDAIKRYREVLKLNPTNFEASVGLDSAQEARDKAPPRPSSPPPEE